MPAVAGKYLKGRSQSSVATVGPDRVLSLSEPACASQEKLESWFRAEGRETILEPGKEGAGGACWDELEHIHTARNNPRLAPDRNSPPELGDPSTRDLPVWEIPISSRPQYPAVEVVWSKQQLGPRRVR